MDLWKSSFEKFSQKLLKTEYSRRRNILSNTLLFMYCSVVLLILIHIFSRAELFDCHAGLLIFVIVTYFCQICTIGYLFWFRNIPMFARDSISFLLMMTNIWMILVVIGLKPCAA